MTGTFGITLSRDLLPIQLIHQGKTLPQPNFCFLSEFHIKQTRNY